MTPDQLAAQATAILADLIAIDTTSRESNLDLIAYVERHLGQIGVTGRRVFNAEGTKANLYATIGRWSPAVSSCRDIATSCRSMDRIGPAIPGG